MPLGGGGGGGGAGIFQRAYPSSYPAQVPTSVIGSWQFRRVLDVSIR